MNNLIVLIIHRIMNYNRILREGELNKVLTNSGKKKKESRKAAKTNIHPSPREWEKNQRLNNNKSRAYRQFSRESCE